jgi:hypothetical protein
MAVALAVALWILNARATFGYGMRAVGANARAARSPDLGQCRDAEDRCCPAPVPGSPVWVRWQVAPDISRWTY